MPRMQEHFTVDARTLHIECKNIAPWMQEHCSVDAEKLHPAKQTTLCGSRNIAQWIKKYFSMDAGTLHQTKHTSLCKLELAIEQLFGHQSVVITNF